MKTNLSLTLITLFATFQLHAQNDYSFRQLYKVHSPASVAISTSDGYIKAVKGKPDQVEVYFAVFKDNKLQDISLEELQEHLDIDINTSGHGVSIAVRQPNKNWISNWRDRYRVSFTVMVPEQTSCELKSSDGNITVSDLTGDQTCRTSDGDIDITTIAGDVSAHTSDGNIMTEGINGDIELVTSDGDIRIAEISGTASLRTSDGDIQANDVSSDIEAVTSDGNIHFVNTRGVQSARTSDGNISFDHLQGSLTAHTSDGHIEGSINKLSDKLELRSSDGDIEVEIPAGLGMDLYLKGEKIKTQLTAFDGTSSDHKIEGRVRGGGVQVNLETSDGTITLEEY